VGITIDGLEALPLFPRLVGTPIGHYAIASMSAPCGQSIRRRLSGDEKMANGTFAKEFRSWE
jgi:hypothetical protein